MIYRIREKFWSWGNDFLICDQNGNDAFLVDGKAFSWGDQLSFQDMQGQELAYISQKLLSWKPRYQIFINGNLYAEVIKEWSWFNKQFTLNVPGPNDYTIDGSFWSHEFQFKRFGKVVATVSKNFWGWTDSYGVEIDDKEDEVAILCSCIVIDQVLHDDQNNSSD